MPLNQIPYVTYPPSYMADLELQQFLRSHGWMEHSQGERMFWSKMNRSGYYTTEEAICLEFVRFMHLKAPSDE